MAPELPRDGLTVEQKKKKLYSKVSLSCVWKHITFTRAYQLAIDGYLRAATTRQPDDARSHAGRGIKEYLKDLWMAFILVNALLIAASMTPFSQAATQAATARNQSALGAMMPAQNSSSRPIEYDHQAIGIVWSVTLSFSCCALTVSMLLLGYMLAVPEEDICAWAKEKGELHYLGFPALLTVAGTLMFIFAVNYSAAVYYGFWAAVPVMAIFFVGIVAGLLGTGEFSHRGSGGNSLASHGATPKVGTALPVMQQPAAGILDVHCITDQNTPPAYNPSAIGGANEQSGHMSTPQGSSEALRYRPSLTRSHGSSTASSLHPLATRSLPAAIGGILRNPDSAPGADTS